MLRSQTVNTIYDLHHHGKSVQEIALELGISRTSVRKYLKHSEAVVPKPRTPRAQKLDPFKDQIRSWVMEDHCINCEVIFERLKKQGYIGGIPLVKNFVQPPRPAVAGHAPVQRYESKPGEQLQFDWGEFLYEENGEIHKFYGFIAILGYSRMRFVKLVKRCDTATLIRCLMEAFEYFGGLTKVALTDRMKSVLLEMVENKAKWNPRFADFMVSIGVTARVWMASFMVCPQPNNSQAKRCRCESVEVRSRSGTGKRVLTIEQRPESQACVPHPEQWQGVASVAQTRRTPAPLAHQKPAPEVVHRPLSEYERLAGWEGQEAFA